MNKLTQNLARTWQKNFQQWDRNGDSAIDSGELFQNIADSNIKGKDAAALAVLYREAKHQARRAGSEESLPIDSAQIESFLSQADERHLDSAYAHYFSKIQNTSDRPYSQGLAPSCGFVSAAYALERRQPGALQSMVKEANGALDVTFPGAKHTISLNALTPTEQALHTESLGSLEKAWGIHESGQEIGAIAKARANQPERPIKALTGNESVTRTLPNSFLYAHLNRALSAKKPGAPALKPPPIQPIIKEIQNALEDEAVVVTGTWKGPLPTKGLQSAHAYTVLACDDESIQLRNPHGMSEPGDDGENDGIFHLSHQEYADNFMSVTMEQRSPE